MPIKQLLFAILASATSCLAATTIEVSAKFADVAAGTEVPAKPDLLAKMKGVNVLSAPRVTTNPGQLATIEVNQENIAPDGSAVPLGVTLTINPTLTEKGGIAFTGKATDRFKHGQRTSESLSVQTFVARETYFKGVTSSGSTVLLNGIPATSTPAKSGAGTPSKARELVIYLTFKKVTTDPEKKPDKPATKKKTEKPATKPSGSQSSSGKKKSTKQ